MENIEISIEEYLKKIGFDKEETEYIMQYANNEIDKKALHEKIKFLISLLSLYFSNSFIFLLRISMLFDFVTKS